MGENRLKPYHPKSEQWGESETMAVSKPNVSVADLNKLRDEIHKNAVDKGFYDDKTDLGTKLMLTVSELSECLEADRKGKYADMKEFDRYIANNIMGFNWSFKHNIKDTVEDELADAAIRILDICGFMKVDIEKHVRMKMKYNAGREMLHGKRY